MCNSYFMLIGVGVACRIYLYVSISGLIISVWEYLLSIITAMNPLHCFITVFTYDFNVTLMMLWQS